MTTTEHSLVNLHLLRAAPHEYWTDSPAIFRT
jgi:hypothetical protein